jgi:hypothetical protein
MGRLVGAQAAASSVLQPPPPDVMDDAVHSSDEPAQNTARFLRSHARDTPHTGPPARDAPQRGFEPFQVRAAI